VELPRIPPVWKERRLSSETQGSQVSLSDALREWKQQQKERSAFASFDGIDTTRGVSHRLTGLGGSNSRLLNAASFSL
jgi:hypothetical protein